MREKADSAFTDVCYTCPGCARVLTVFTQLQKAPYCTRCGKTMQVGPADAVPGQMALFIGRAVSKQRK